MCRKPIPQHPGLATSLHPVDNIVLWHKAQVQQVDIVTHLRLQPISKSGWVEKHQYIRASKGSQPVYIFCFVFSFVIAVRPNDLPEIRCDLQVPYISPPVTFGV